VAATLAANWWRQRAERLPIEAEAGWTAGQEALDRGDFDGAKQLLGKAARAFVEMGGKDERTQGAVLLAKEAAILADLSAYRLDEILDQAARSDPATWATTFEREHRGRAVILDTEVAATPAAGQSAGAYELAHRVLVGRGPEPARVGRIDLEGFRLTEGRALAVGEPVVFGARLEALDFRDGVWSFRLQPESGVWMTRFGALEAKGWTPRDTVEAAPVIGGG
jgi:hypothetical protein